MTVGAVSQSREGSQVNLSAETTVSVVYRGERKPLCGRTDAALFLFGGIGGGGFLHLPLYVSRRTICHPSGRRHRVRYPLVSAIWH